MRLLRGVPKKDYDRHYKDYNWIMLTAWLNCTVIPQIANRLYAPHFVTESYHCQRKHKPRKMWHHGSRVPNCSPRHKHPTESHFVEILHVWVFVLILGGSFIPLCWGNETMQTKIKPTPTEVQELGWTIDGHHGCWRPWRPTDCVALGCRTVRLY